MELQLPFYSLTASFLVLFIVLKFSRRRNDKRNAVSGKKRAPLPPGPRKLPLIGSIHRMLGVLPHHALRSLSDEHGPVMHLKLGATELVVVSSPAAAKEIMSANDANFASRPDLYVLTLGGFGSLTVAMSPYGEYWRQLRKIAVTELLSPKRVRSFASIREEAISSLVEGILTSNGSPVNLTRMLFGFTNAVVSRATCGREFRHHERFVSTVMELMKLATGFGIQELYPSAKFIGVVTGMKARYTRCYRRLDAMLEEIIREHQAKTPEHGREDLVDVLLRIREDGGLTVPLTNESIKAVISEMFTGGTETTSSVIEWAMAELARKPEVMAKAQAEARRILRGKDTISECDAGELKYLSMVIKETLRLHPPAPLLLPRVCAEACEVGGYEIPAGMKVMVNAWALGRHPDYWEDAESFQPERFDESGLDFKGANFQFVPFGAGRRNCPGITFGVGMVELALANLLYRFDWELPDGMVPADFDMTETFGVTACRKSELLLIARPYVCA